MVFFYTDRVRELALLILLYKSLGYFNRELLKVMFCHQTEIQVQ